MENEKVVEASKAFVRIIVRRPHAYQMWKDYPRVPIPGLLFLGSDGALKGSQRLTDLDDLGAVLEAMEKYK
jgi:hypothetical protein